MCESTRMKTPTPSQFFEKLNCFSMGKECHNKQPSNAKMNSKNSNSKNSKSKLSRHDKKVANVMRLLNDMQTKLNSLELNAMSMEDLDSLENGILNFDSRLYDILNVVVKTNVREIPHPERPTVTIQLIQHVHKDGSTDVSIGYRLENGYHTKEGIECDDDLFNLDDNAVIQDFNYYYDDENEMQD